ncbi:zinc-binding alcohol dehydrogenase family protein [Halotalea alkalilenta]|uniref:zinc-binding alcohol dehydrogenase family protein n=1 Tax=Halotalea alkalilenta TaxID=376489 RepID=UPI000AC73AA9|nr:zinc-binding alcohol dehydrogenase family protein [Halotalea alkalilenta]
MTGQTRILSCIAPGELRLSTTSLGACGPNEVLVKVLRVGICGTDIHAFAGQQPYFTYPRVLGHELSVEVVAAGSPRDRDMLGRKGYVIPYLHDPDSPASRRGKTNCCERLKVIGVHRDGGMSDFLVLPARHVVPSDLLDAEQLALVECLAIGAHGVRRSGLRAGETAVVVGAGPIGMGVIQIARARGARVIVIDPNSQRLAFCREKLGVTEAVDPREYPVEEAVAALTDGGLADVVFDATGNPDAIARGFALVGHGGRYVLVSLVKADITFHDPEFHRREITLLASRNATREDFDTVTRLMEAGALAEREMITHRAELEQMPAVMAHWCAPATGVIKGLVHVND